VPETVNAPESRIGVATNPYKVESQDLWHKSILGSIPANYKKIALHIKEVGRANFLAMSLINPVSVIHSTTVRSMVSGHDSSNIGGGGQPNRVTTTSTLDAFFPHDHSTEMPISISPDFLTGCEHVGF